MLPGFKRFLGLYAFANAGAYIAFIPLLTLILPLKAQQIAPDDKLMLLSTTLFFGAIMASVANIIAGAVSDRLYQKWGSRTVQMATGLLLVLLSYYFFYLTTTWLGLIASILYFQFAFNFMFSPLGALLADHVPNHVKGRASALLNLGTPVATLFVAILALPMFLTEMSRLSLISLVIVLAIIPLLFVAAQQRELISAPLTDELPTSGTKSNQQDFIWAWIARLSVQFSGAVIFGYILYYLQDVVQYSLHFPGEAVDQAMGKLSFAATPITIIFGILAGTISDHLGLRKPFLIFAAVATSASIWAMSIWPSWPLVFGAYSLFIASLTMFLTIDAALVTQLLAGAPNRARKLGIMNLTNTIPAIVAPAVAIVISSSRLEAHVLVILMQVAGSVTLIAALAVSRIQSVD